MCYSMKLFVLFWNVLYGILWEVLDDISIVLKIVFWYNLCIQWHFPDVIQWNVLAGTQWIILYGIQ